MVVYKNDRTTVTVGITTQLRNDCYYDGDMVKMTLILLDKLYESGWKRDNSKHFAQIQIIVGATLPTQKSISKSDLGIKIIRNNPGESRFIKFRNNWPDEVIKRIQ